MYIIQSHYLFILQLGVNAKILQKKYLASDIWVLVVSGWAHS